LIPFEYQQDTWHQQTTVPGLSCGIVCVNQHLAILTQYRRVSDRRMDRQQVHRTGNKKA